MTDTLRVEVRFRNNVLWHAIKDNYPTICGFATQHQLSRPTVFNLVNLRDSPWYVDGAWSKTAIGIATALQREADELFPFALYENYALSVVHVQEMPAEQFVSLSEIPQDQRLVSGQQEMADLSDTIQHVLDLLAPTDRHVVECMYGLNGRTAMTMSEIARAKGVSPTRIKQIHGRAIGRLRTRKRHKLLIPYYEDMA
jgi:hypothetical protein